jgi:hypothetical protein
MAQRRFIQVCRLPARNDLSRAGGPVRTDAGAHAPGAPPPASTPSKWHNAPPALFLTESLLA